jgi:hypothetical protein
VNRDLLADLIQRASKGRVPREDALAALERLPAQDLGYARVDHLRPLTQGFPEVVLAEGKSPEQVVGICEALEGENGSFLATRTDDPTRRALLDRFPRVELNQTARTAYLAPDPLPEPLGRGTILVLSAGTSDLPVAEEAAVVARAMGNQVATLYDVGVAGIHRLLEHTEQLRHASVVIVVAGMDGALASVVGGMVDSPVIAVPTSVGYGAAFGGVSALLAMLNSCASGVTVVNIDNGFGAAAAAARINRRRS